MAATGCGGGAAGPRISPGLDVFLQTEDGRRVRYEVLQDGTIHFAGGRDAADGDWSWTGQLDASQGALLKSAIAEGRWFDKPPKGIPGDGTRWRVKAEEGGRTVRFDVEGEAPSVRTVWGLLDDAGKARLQDDLDRLPKADIEQYMHRRRVEQVGESSP